jgi:hypothetical protein
MRRVVSLALRASLPRRGALSAGAALSLVMAGSLAAQAPDRAALEAYYRAVGQHFGVPPDEVSVLSEWRLDPEEIPVVLYIAARGGISPDAVVALREGGTGWPTVARRYALDAGSFHVRMEGAVGSLARLYEEYAARPQAQWGSITLRDDDVIDLVNLRVLSEVLRTGPAMVLQARERTGSWIMAHRSITLLR